MNQEYRDRVKRHLEAGGDPKYVNVKRKAAARHEAYSAKTKALERKKDRYVSLPSGGRGKVKTAESEHTKHYDQNSKSWK